MFSFSKKRNTQKIYLDYASTTPVSKEVLKAMRPYFDLDFFNPSAIYDSGVRMRKIIDDCRLRISKILRVKSGEIFFTSSGTESDNLAVLGVFEYFKNDENFKVVPHIITSNIEHPAILESCKEVERRGGEVTYIRAEKDGAIDPRSIAMAIKENTVLITVMYANNEIGTIHPLGKIARAIKDWKSKNERGASDFPYFHTDSSQTPLFLDCNCEKLGVDLMTLDGSKIYGPKGISILFKKEYVPIKALLFGGGQENGLRPSTENVPAIIGMTKAFEIADKERNELSKKLSGLRDYFIQKLLALNNGASLNGSQENRLPNNVNVCFPRRNSEFLVIQLSEKGIACSFMTACKNLDDDSSSYVIRALGKDDCTTSSLRFTLGRETTKKEIDLTTGALAEIFSKNLDNQY